MIKNMAFSNFTFYTCWKLYVCKCMC